MISELAVARLGQHYLADKDAYSDEIEKLTRWCIRALTTPEGQAFVQNRVSFRLPQPMNHTIKFPTIPVSFDAAGRVEAPQHADANRRQRN